MQVFDIERELQASRTSNPNEIVQLRTRIHAHLSRKAVSVQRMVPGRMTKLPAVAIEYFDLLADVAALAWDYARSCRYVFGSIFNQALHNDAQLTRLFADFVASPTAECCRSRLLHVLVRCVLTRLSLHSVVLGHHTLTGHRGPAFRQCIVVMTEVLDSAMTRICYHHLTPSGNMTQITMLNIVDNVTAKFKQFLDADTLQSTFNQISIVQHCEFKLPFDLNDVAGASMPHIPYWEEMYDSLIEASDDCCHSLMNHSGSELVVAIGTKALQAFLTCDEPPEDLHVVDRQLLVSKIRSHLFKLVEMSHFSSVRLRI